MKDIFNETNKMKVDTLKIKLELKKEELDAEIKWKNERIKMHKFIIIASLVTLMILCSMTTWFMELNGFNAFSIALLTVTGYTEIRSLIDNKFEIDKNIRSLEVEIKWIEHSIENLKANNQ